MKCIEVLNYKFSTFWLPGIKTERDFTTTTSCLYFWLKFQALIISAETLGKKRSTLNVSLFSRSLSFFSSSYHPSYHLCLILSIYTVFVLKFHVFSNNFFISCLSLAVGAHCWDSPLGLANGARSWELLLDLVARICWWRSLMLFAVDAHYCTDVLLIKLWFRDLSLLPFCSAHVQMQHREVALCL